MSSDYERTHDEVELHCPTGHTWPWEAPRHISLTQWTNLIEAQQCPECGIMVRLRTGDYNNPGTDLRVFP